MDINRLSTSEKIAGAGAVLLLVAILFLNWYDVGRGVGFSDSNSGIRELIFWLTALAVIGLVAAKAASANVNLPVAASAIVAALGILAFLLVAIRVIDPPGPDGVDRAFGLFVALVGTGMIAYGGFTSMQEEGTSFGEEANRLGDSGPGPR